MTDPATPVEQPERLSAEREQQIRVAAGWNRRLTIGKHVAELLAEVDALRSTIAHLEAEQDRLRGVVGDLTEHARKRTQQAKHQQSRKNRWRRRAELAEARAAADAPKLQAAIDETATWWDADAATGNADPRFVSGVKAACRHLAAALFPDPEDPPAPTDLRAVLNDDSDHYGAHEDEPEETRP